MGSEGVNRLTIEQLDQQTIKVTLSPCDMDGYELTYEEMDYNCPNTRRVILKLLQEIKTETKLDLSRGKLFIEAFPYEEGGCILYINVINGLEGRQRRRAGLNTPLAFSFDSLETLGGACASLCGNYSHLILKSALYREGEHYLLLLYSFFKMDDKLAAIVCEFGRYQGKGERIAARAAEHAHCLLPEKAIETIARCLA